MHIAKTFVCNRVAKKWFRKTTVAIKFIPGNINAQAWQILYNETDKEYLKQYDKWYSRLKLLVRKWQFIEARMWQIAHEVILTDHQITITGRVH